MIDTCVWLDVAKDIRGETLIAATRVLVHQRQVELLVPQVVIDEYDRNRDQVILRLGQSTRTHVKMARAALAEHGRGDKYADLIAELDEVAMRGPLIEQLVEGRFDEVSELLRGGIRVEPNDESIRAVVQRGLDKRAPFHGKASVADALLIEMYAAETARAGNDATDQFGFVTHNSADFSDPRDKRAPHPDLLAYFESGNSTYFTSIKDAYTRTFPDDFAELSDELDFFEDPRSGQEIRAAEKRLFDLRWYQFSRRSMDPVGAAARARIEASYSPEELGPFTDYGLGMLDGKHSALRWVMGDEWDFLDL